MFPKKLKQLRKERNQTQRDVAEHLDITQQAVAKWEAGSGMPEASVLLRLAEHFGVGVDELLGRSKTGFVRVIGTVKAGYNAFAYEEDLGSEPAAVTDAENYRYLVVTGDSMEPYIHHGDMALVKIQPVLQNGELGVFIYGDGEATLKRFHREGDCVTLEPFNPEYDKIILRGEELSDLRIFGRVVETKTTW